MKALVLGGYGAVGARIVAELRDGGAVALAAGRDPRRADLVVDLRDPHSLAAALPRVDVVVNASGAEDPVLVETVTRHGAAFVDITATMDYLAAVERLQPSRPVLLSVGLAPGLTNLLADAVHDLAPEQPIDIALLLGAGERHGGASTAWAYGLFGRRFPDTGTGEEVLNYSRPRRFDLPGHGSRRLYRADYADQHVLSRDLGVAVRTYFGLDSRIGTVALAALTRVPGAAKAPSGLHPPGGDQWLALAQAGDGTARWMSGRIEAQATAVMATAAARAVLGLPAGTHHLHQVLKLADVEPLRPSFA